MSASINSGVAPNWSWARPMRNVAPATATETGVVRPPDLGNAPTVSGTNGLGAGGGAGIGGNADAAWGHVRVFVGLAPAASGNIFLIFPSSQIMTYLADWATLTVTGNGSFAHAIAWTANAPLVPNARPLILAYERTVSE